MAKKGSVPGDNLNESSDKSRFRFEKLNSEERRNLLEKFASHLKSFLDSTDTRDEEVGQVDRTKIMESLKIDVRQFDNFLRELYKDGYLHLSHHRIATLAEDLKKKPEFNRLQDITVVAGSDKKRFGQAAAEDFIRRMIEIGQEKKKKGPCYLNVGIVSGSTTGGVIREAIGMDWSRYFQGFNLENLPPIQVFCLNVCLTVSEHLAGNATILAYELAEKIKKEGKLDVSAYGLSAPLMVEKKNLKEVDQAPQTFEVLTFTEPARVQDKLISTGVWKEKKPQDHTELDIVLTGVGEKLAKNVNERSIFYKLAKDHGFDMDSIIEQDRLIGDIAFTGIRSDGVPVSLLKKEDEYMFYSAIQVQVLKAMANLQEKSVILVARHNPNKDKIPAIFASVAHRYVSRLIIDEETAKHLNRF